MAYQSAITTPFAKYPNTALKKLLAGVVICTSLAIFGYTLYNSISNGGSFNEGANVPKQSLYVPQDIAQESTYSDPRILTIPSIGVNAKVQKVGVTSKGEMGIPSNFKDVGWYKYGPRPGEVGSAVIDGHVDNALGLAGVFKRLKETKKGDDIYVIDKEGKKIHFKIIDIKEYKYDKAPAEQIFHETDRRLLRLITCGGTWIRSLKTYDKRVVVTAELVQ